MYLGFGLLIRQNKLQTELFSLFSDIYVINLESNQSEVAAADSLRFLQRLPHKNNVTSWEDAGPEDTVMCCYLSKPFDLRGAAAGGGDEGRRATRGATPDD